MFYSFRRMIKHRLLSAFACLLVGLFAYPQTIPIAHGHAHNDYIHKRPLFEAVENGFTSIEIDVYLHHDQLVVSHVALALNRKKTIEELYLNPIKKIIEQNGGWVYKGISQPVIFMIDFKTDGTATYTKLKEILAKYQDMITVYQGDSVVQQRAINILISGGSPIAALLKEDKALATVDAGIGAIANSEVRKVATRFSGSWGGYFMWRGIGKMPHRQKEKLDSLVAAVHAYHKDIRFWAIPDKPKVWQLLLQAGVDWINTNKLGAFHRFQLTSAKN